MNDKPRQPNITRGELWTNGEETVEWTMDLFTGDVLCVGSAIINGEIAEECDPIPRWAQPLFMMLPVSEGPVVTEFGTVFVTKRDENEQLH